MVRSIQIGIILLYPTKDTGDPLQSLLIYDWPAPLHMQMPESNLNTKTPIRHLLKVICGFDTRYILKFIPQIT
jgi:hypothetical protein